MGKRERIEALESFVAEQRSRNGLYTNGLDRLAAIETKLADIDDRQNTQHSLWSQLNSQAMDHACRLRDIEERFEREDKPMRGVLDRLQKDLSRASLAYHTGIVAPAEEPATAPGDSKSVRSILRRMYDNGECADLAELEAVVAALNAPAPRVVELEDDVQTQVFIFSRVELAENGPVLVRAKGGG